MNPMIAALQKSRQDAPPAPPTPDENAPEQDAEAGPGDALVQKLEDLDGKLDQILELLGADQNEDASSENDGTEAPPNDNGD